MLNPTPRDLRCLSQFLITGNTVFSFIFFRSQCSDLNHSGSSFAHLVVLHAPQDPTMLVSGGRVLLNRIRGLVRSSKKARERQLQRLLDYLWDAFGAPCGSFCLRDSLGAQGNRFVPDALAGTSNP